MKVTSEKTYLGKNVYVIIRSEFARARVVGSAACCNMVDVVECPDVSALILGGYTLRFTIRFA